MAKKKPLKLFILLLNPTRNFLRISLYISLYTQSRRKPMVTSRYCPPAALIHYVLSPPPLPTPKVSSLLPAIRRETFHASRTTSPPLLLYIIHPRVPHVSLTPQPTLANPPKDPTAEIKFSRYLPTVLCRKSHATDI